MGKLPDHADLVIVGGGPAGLAAAIEARKAGLSVAVLEREPTAGGIPRHCNHPPYGVREFGRLMKGPTYARRLVAEAAAAGADIRTGVTVLALHSGPRLTVTDNCGARDITARRVLLATGVRETSRAGRLLGGTKPGGILNTGALQGLVTLDGLVPFQRPVILGTELVSFSAILTLRHAGVRPVAMLEPASTPTARWPSAMLPRLLRIPLHLGTDIVAIEGEQRVTGVRVRGPGGERTIPADGVVLTGRFRPETALMKPSHLALDAGSGGPVVDQYGRCSDPDYFAAGNVLRPVETAGWSFREGAAAGRAVAADLAGDLPAAAPFLTIAAGEGIKLAVPQRIAPGARGGALQVRVDRPLRGRLVLSLAGKAVASQRIDTRPERRLSVPLSAIPQGATGTATLTVEEAA
ncbi:FAD/NAD(P)-binding oxidoreductase [Acuticoccus sp. MNP-M23]|uniref:NAD(P)/FAD-dependent oxidoreductase n=1 Tax=Acuticoccus sp. MNP-M23 TaxID=3072793 RepID=UPI0028159B33|nr:FAD/NAD(P)-binding oxidoreductase [Acuticoccus sp. MNP-M23]WMS44712.1 FAD/NAD(P)-binding oxidoreductase [Acuticoccus sp. MNP-M23]